MLARSSSASDGPTADADTGTTKCQLAEFCDVTLKIAVPGVADGESVVVDVLDEADPVLAASRDTVAEARGGAVEVGVMQIRIPQISIAKIRPG